MNTAFKNHENLKMIFKPTKDKIPKEQSSNIIYSVPNRSNETVPEKQIERTQKQH